MYNKVKRALGLASAILSIVLGAFACFCTLLGIIGGGVIGNAATIIISILGLPAWIGCIVFGAKLVKHPVKFGDVWEDRKSKHVALTVFLGIALGLSIFYFSFFITLAEEFVSYYADESALLIVIGILFYLVFFLALAAMPLNIVSMCLKAEKKVEVKEEPVVVFEDFEPEKETKVDDKIEQLKHLKETGVITQEQYDEAIKNIVDKIVD